MAAVSVIRMIKLFGWEARIGKQLEERREDELAWYKKQRQSEIGLGITGCVL